MNRPAAALLIAAALASSLAACGRRGPPQHPEGSVYPREYPTVNFPSATAAPGTPGRAAPVPAVPPPPLPRSLPPDFETPNAPGAQPATEPR